MPEKFHRLINNATEPRALPSTFFRPAWPEAWFAGVRCSGRNQFANELVKKIDYPDLVAGQAYAARHSRSTTVKRPASS